MKENKHIFDHAIRTADVLVRTLGKSCEVAIHDFSSLDKSLIYLAGKLTNRKIGSPATSLVLRELQKKDTQTQDIVNYKTVSDTGIVMKSSTVFLRNEESAIIGALCINIDISLLIQIGGEIQDFIKIENTDIGGENFYSSVNEVVENMVNEVVKTFNKIPSMLNREEKIDCVRQLEEKGAFLIKGVVEYLATVLRVSKFTIYNYLKEIRSKNEYLDEGE